MLIVLTSNGEQEITQVQDYIDPLDNFDEDAALEEPFLQISSDQDPLSTAMEDYLRPLSAIIAIELAGQRLDRALVSLFPQYTRARLQAWLEAGRILVDGKPPAKASGKVQAGQTIDVSPEAPPHMQAMLPEDIPLDVLFENDDCLVLNKPAGMVVHPAAGNWSGTMLNGLLHRWPQLANLPRAGIVHRLDKETSGLLVVAKTATAQTQLITQLQARTVRRIYFAIVWGRVSRQVTVNAKIGRDPHSRLRMAVVGSGKHAITHFFPLIHGLFERVPVSLVACKLETGRTHQIRVHAMHAGFGLLGDPVYKQSKTPPVSFARQGLHAAQLSFRLPAERANQADWQTCFAPPPSDMLQWMSSLGIDADFSALLERLEDIWPNIEPEPFEPEGDDADEPY